jgi:hypothetical protein
MQHATKPYKEVIHSMDTVKDNICSVQGESVFRLRIVTTLVQPTIYNDN